ncbi:hypothetical protein C1H46_019621 [Malus baccata]|uniref:Uncharacterized protein n=1 Tax=Malus baccata TaxID=106549 RepID=A0A540M7P0_MALBA|nr:hypothetical protein C1H46_019621 [Malus baccata]
MSSKDQMVEEIYTKERSGGCSDQEQKPLQRSVERARQCTTSFAWQHIWVMLALVIWSSNAFASSTIGPTSERLRDWPYKAKTIWRESLSLIRF